MSSNCIQIVLTNTEMSLCLIGNYDLFAKSSKVNQEKMNQAIKNYAAPAGSDCIFAVGKMYVLKISTTNSVLQIFQGLCNLCVFSLQSKCFVHSFYDYVDGNGWTMFDHV